MTGQHAESAASDGRRGDRRASTDSEVCKTLFQKCDKSGNGVIEKDILGRVLARLAPTLTTNDINLLIDASASAQGDGVDYVRFIDTLKTAEMVKPDIILKPGSFEYKMIEDYRNQSQELKDLVEQHDKQFNDLKERHKKRAFQFVGRLYTLQQAEHFFEKECTHNDHEALKHTLQACNLPGMESTRLDLSEFMRLHRATGQILGDLDQASWGAAGKIFSSDYRVEFKKSNLDGDSSIGLPEIAQWLHKIFDVVRGDQFPSFQDMLHSIELRCRAIREIEKFINVMELHQGMAQYGVAYRKMKAHENYAPIESKNPEHPLQQPDCNTLDALFEQAGAVVKKVETLGEEVRANIGAPFWSMGGLKGRLRSQEKIDKDYDGNVRRLLDIVRFSVVCDDLDMVRNAIYFLEHHDDIKILRIKSGFNRKAGSAAQQGGYRDVKVNCAHQINGHIFEVQLHVLSFYSLKRESGHNMYIWSRQFAVAGIVNATDVLDDLSADLLEEMSAVARREIQVVSNDRGDDSIQTMQWRIALAQIAKITKNKTDLEVAKLLHNMVSSKCIPAATLNDVAEITLLVGKNALYNVEKSLELCYEALRMIKEIDEEDQTVVETLFVARAHHAIGSCFYFRGKQAKKKKEASAEDIRRDMESAVENYKKAIQVFTSHLQPHHPMVLGITKNLGETFNELSRSDEALLLLLKNERAIVEHLGPNHLQTGKACHALGKAFQSSRKFAEAIAHLERSLSIRTSNVGDCHASVAMGFVQLGQCRYEAGDYTGAVHDLTKAKEMYEALAAGTSRPRTGPRLSRQISTITAASAVSSSLLSKPSLKNGDKQDKWNNELKEIHASLGLAEKAAESSSNVSPFLVCTLNFLGNAYNPMEFMNSDADFQVNYPVIKKAFERLTSAVIIDEANRLGLGADLAKLLPGTSFVEHCTKDFLKRDNKLDLTGRTNMIVAGMLKLENSGKPLFQHVLEWRDLMKHQTEHYANDPELVAWDIACNLSAEQCVAEYQALSASSYLNPELMPRNVQTLLSHLPPDQEFVCAVQEFPEEGMKHTLLLKELESRGWNFVPPKKHESSVGYLHSANVEVLKATQAPLGEDPAKVYEALGLTDYDNVADSDKKSLKTTATKTCVLEIAAYRDRPAFRFINIHAKEFKTPEGTRLLAKYMRGLAGDGNGYVTVALTDANTPSRDKTETFCDELVNLGFNVLSPNSAGYITTRKQRSQMHGQIYDEKKCLQIVEAHKTYAAMLPPSSGNGCVARSNAHFYPDLRFSDQNLPDPTWPSDHCMLYIELYASPTSKPS